MATMDKLEQRVQVLQRDIDEIRAYLGLPRPSRINRMPPMNAEELAAFDEMVEYGRQFRYADRPIEENDEDWSE